MSKGVLDQFFTVPDDSWADRCLSEISSLSTAPAELHEKRSSVRYAASGVAIIKPEFGLPITCTLVDRSEGGARLKVLSVLGIPDTFILIIEAEQMRARIAWRSVGEIGVALTHG